MTAPLALAPLPVGHRVVVPELADNPEEALGLMRLEPIEAPAVGAREVLVAVESAAVGWVDLIMASGQYQHVPTPPYTPGLEYAGRVVRVGADVRPDEARLNDKVVVDGMVAGPRSSGAYRGAGGFATYALVPVEALRPIPGDLTCDEVAGFFGNYETAYFCLVTRGQLQAGEVVLIHGAAGSTGLAAVHVAKQLGAVVIATGRSDEKLAVVRAEGADHVLNIRDAGAHFRDAVKALTGGRGVDVVYDGVGGDVSLESLRCVTFGARYLIVGWASTPDVAQGRGLRGAPNANMLPTNLIMMKGLTVMGSPMVISTTRDPSLRAPRVAALRAWIEAGAFRPHVSHRFALADFQAALRAKWRGEVVGSAVLQP